MHGAGIRPNVRTYTALVAALGRGCQWGRAQRLLREMRRGQPWGGVEPNAYTYSALLKAMGEMVGTLQSFARSTSFTCLPDPDTVLDLCQFVVHAFAVAEAP